MSVHLEYNLAVGNRLRTGTLDSATEAIAMFERLLVNDDRLTAAAVFEGSHGVSIHQGKMTAVRSDEGEWIRDDAGFPEPDWWYRVPALTQSWLIDHAGEPLDADAVLAVTQARGVGPTAAGFVNGDQGVDGYLLDRGTTNWLRAENLRRSFG